MKKKIFRLLPLAILPMLLSGCEPAHQHEYDYELTTEPTCVTKGIETGTCECGEEITREVDALGHLKEVIDGTPATCTEEGLTDGEKCSRCDEVLVEQETIAKLRTIL